MKEFLEHQEHEESQGSSETNEQNDGNDFRAHFVFIPDDEPAAQPQKTHGVRIEQVDQINPEPGSECKPQGEDQAHDEEDRVTHCIEVLTVEERTP
jgi:hypothetical protein